MTQNSEKTKSTPLALRPTLSTLGERIQSARKRRNLTMNEMASRMFVTRKTLSRLEKGEGGVTLFVLSSALWVLGMENQLLLIADPTKDEVGMFMEKQRLPKRIRNSRTSTRLDF